MASAWSQLDQLLTCAICLDRYRNPKLLPCQHTFCMDPCLEGLIDYARRQIKCPECRAEHRIPYQGVQAFPTNVTLIRFLELHRDITGEEPEPPPSMMERCSVCSEKSNLDRCAHCDKKICQDCKEAHADVLRREINRINTQIRRGLGKLSDALSQTQKNAEKLQQNCHLVKDEIEEIVRRYTKDLRDTEDKLKHDVDLYIQTELRNLTKLKDNLDVEVTNMNSNCELVDKYISDSVEWTDLELVEYKDIFLKTLEFIRNFDPDTSDFGRKIRFMPKADPDVLHRTLSDFGELKINAPLVAATLNLAPPQGNALMRSQSDHRLAAQFQRRQEGSRSYLDVNQRFGGHASDSERDGREPVSSSPLFGRSRRDMNEPGYRRYSDRGGREDYMDQRDVGRNRFIREDMSSRWRDGEVEHGGYRSRYGRDSEYGQDADHHSSHTRTVRFEEPASSPQRERVLETDDASKGPLSGISKLIDSPIVLERLRQSENRQKQQEKEKEKAAVEPPPAPTPVPVPQPPPRRTVRQLSEDEIEKQKRQNQLQASTTTTAPTATTVTSQVSTPTPPARSTPTPPHSPITERERPVLRRVATLQKEDEKRIESSGRIQRQGSMSPDSERLSTSRRGSQQDDTEAARSRRKNTESESALPGSPQSTPESPKPSRSIKPTLGKALSLDSRDDISRPTISRVQEQREEERKLSESPRPVQSSFYGRMAASRRPEPQPEPKEEPKPESEEEDSEEESDETESESESESEESSSESGDNADEGNKTNAAAEEQEESSSTSSESEEEKEVTPPSPPPSRSTPIQRRDSTDYTTSRITPRTNYTNSYSWDKDDTTRSSYRSKWWEANRTKDEYVPKYSSILSNRRKSTYDEDEDDNKPYSRFLARSRSSALIGNTTTKEDSPPEDNGRYRRYSTTAANLRRSRIARSKSSHDIGFGEESAEDESPSTPTYRSNRSWRSPENSTISKTRSSLKSREASPEEEERPAWSKYLRNKYGTSSYGNTRSVLRSRSSHAICSRSASENSSEDEYVSPSNRRGSIGKLNGNYILSNPRSTYVQKKRMLMKIGIRGTEPGRFTWPRGVCVGPDNSIVVADSSNHRVQVFDMNGKFQHEFGTYGSAEGEFDCLAGVVVNRIGQFIVSDRYNHRIQVFDPKGRFLRAFGSEGRGEARFSYPWGITTDSLGFIYICDKENHRVQVFQSDGTFVGKFGTIGTRPGQLEHPHYIAVTNTNRVVVSDTNNHRIQTFDVNGRSLSTFGTEGSEEGQFKFPRGIAVDDQGYIIVGDSGNNRIQIFHPDGTFLKAFGTWGSADGEFKGLEGISVASNGNILVCDRENHRIQVF